MEKRLLESFIRKYTLGGAIEHVTWQSDGNEISVAGTPEDKQIFTFITAKTISVDAGDYSVYDTSQLRSLLAVLEDDVSVDVETTQGIPLALRFKDSQSKVRFSLADPTTIPTAPSLPPLNTFEMEIHIDKDFMQRFTKGASALSEVNSFTVVTEGDDVKFVIGYSDKNTTRISYDVESFGDLSNNPQFSSNHLKNIFLANRDLDKAKIRISDRGVMYIGFDDGEYKCDYYLPKLSHINV